MFRRFLAALPVLLIACHSLKLKGPEPTSERPKLEIPAQPADSQGPTPVLPPMTRQPAAAPALALARGWMPLTATGVPAFLNAHPGWDGRGVLIAILDGGIDPAVPGLDSTTAGRAKLLDLRDFSGEGRVPLTPLLPAGDAAQIGPRRLTGLGRIRAIATAADWYSGLIVERSLGEPPASDLNDNGSDADTLAVLVAKASDGWVLFADTDGDGSLANEHPVHDYLLGHESFGWHRPGARPPLNLAANFSEQGGRPELDLVYDTGGHGTHVGGIAAAHDIGGVRGFDGVAPGAQLLGLKIARNDFGGLTTTGSVVAALDYAIRFAQQRELPLVVNMSFGVGNEREGAARLDAMLDSMLAAHPQVIFVTSAGNDGPGLSTIGFPGSLRNGITVGAIQPAAFLSPATRPARSGSDPLLYFSSRGGELAKPDLAAPGTAYSTIPLWNEGDEFKSGTSMAAPQIAGLAALLLSAAASQHRLVLLEDVRRALMGSARPVPAATFLDMGAGVPDAEAAWGILRAASAPGDFQVSIPGRPGATAAFAIGSADTLVRFRLVRTRGTEPVDAVLSSDVPWLRAPATVRLASSEQELTLVQHPPTTSGVHVGTVTATLPGVSGPLFHLVSTVVTPAAERATAIRSIPALPSGGEAHVVFAADSGRPFTVRIATVKRGETVIAALHQPGGAPNLGDNGIPGAADSAAAVFDVDGRDARAGYYEAVAVAPTGPGLSAKLTVDHAPVQLDVTSAGRDSLAVRLHALSDSVASGRLRFGVLGAERSYSVNGVGGADVEVPFLLPEWVKHLVVDLELDPVQWPRFTDFGFTAVDSSQRILAKAPANYAHARLSSDLAARTSAQHVKIVLAPGFAEPDSKEPWQGRVTIRLQAERPMALEAKEGDEFHLASASTTSFHARLGELPWPLPEGFQPLLLFLVESGGLGWTWEIPRR